MSGSLAESMAHITQINDREIVRRLVNHLGMTAVAALAASSDATAPWSWLESGHLPAGACKRVRVAHHVWQEMVDAENESTTRAWFVGKNPLLGEQSPVLALREGRCSDVLLAAAAFLEGTWSA